MMLPQSEEKRKVKRKKLSGLLPGRLQLVTTSEYLSCRPIDVSAEGLGILTSAILDEGCQVRLHLTDRSIPFIVKWKQQDFGKYGRFRYGLTCEDPQENIEELFIQSHCLL